ncbi:gamma-glutamyltransferase family protein [uncultured Oscillibacter sp.]|uniref:gamma-glutamyltransferase family protein n=1 Tax=uncultured Oscillibacter sp. TaxID=876091 RepID=UPI00280A9177|nr:gamma-glutamyltransferase family protein [uncultured Oscillibacter sp.]
MVQFDSLKYSFASHRNVVYARKGMACSTSPIASQVGLEILKSGGNAMDAAIAMATTLPLVEPTGNGLGSDCFALVWSAKDQKLFGLDGSGVAPMALSAEKVKEAGYTSVPVNGWLPTMVPGAPSAWALLRRRFGTKPMTELMAPAIRYAREGFCIPVNVYKQWKAETARFTAAAEKEPEVFGPWVQYFTKNGKTYEAGDTFYNPDFAATLESLAESDCESYYHGEIMHKIVDFSRKTGGFFAESDFENYQAQWVEPISVNYKGYDVFEMPPNGHGITALMALNMLKGMELSDERETADVYHKMIETTKLAFVDTKKFVADPRYMRTKVSDMLSDRYADVRRALITDQAVYPEAGDPSCGGTVYFCVADGEGNMVSFIQSNYNRFGSGIAVPGTAITIQDRGANFSLDPESDNYLEGGKKAYHTIIPGFLCKDGKAVGPFGVMGGFMQPQGHVQVIVNTVDYHMNPQECLDAPRFQWVGEKKVQLEREVPAHIAQKLADMGHQVEIVNSNLGMGRGEIIWRMEDGTLVGGTEPRADGTIAAW